MTFELHQELIDLINDYGTIKVLATVDEKGQPHSVVKQFMHVLENGNFVYLELLESSRSYKNFTRSLWYNQRVSITVVGGKGEHWQIKGKPEKIIISGPVFERYYKYARKRLGDVDLAAVCIVEPEELVNESFYYCFEQQENQQPIFKHLDRLVKN
ncbi:MAG: pyridoxamine 5'-phosphate oxidase family protein [Candidatus Contendobacter sp.]